METRYFLRTGQTLVTNEACEVRTILGSCISVCLHDPLTGYGAICHFKAPRWMGKGPKDSRYAEIAIPEMLRQMQDKGSKPGSIQAMVIGGGNVIEMNMDVGGENIQAALKILASYSLRAGVDNVGGAYGRDLRFRPHEGTASILKINNMLSADYNRKSSPKVLSFQKAG